MTLLLCVTLIITVVIYALYRKGDVKAAFKVPFVEFTLDAKDRQGGSVSTPNGRSLEETRGRD